MTMQAFVKDVVFMRLVLVGINQQEFLGLLDAQEIDQKFIPLRNNPLSNEILFELDSMLHRVECRDYMALTCQTLNIVLEKEKI